MADSRTAERLRNGPLSGTGSQKARKEAE